MTVQHKTIYALTTRMIPHTTHTWTNPKTEQSFTWIVPEDGVVLFYVGETTMTIEARASKHRTFTRKLIKHIKGEDVIDPHLYPVYFFTTTFCGKDGLDFNIHPLQEGPGLSEAEWIRTSAELGHPLQNFGGGSLSTKSNKLSPGPKTDYKIVNAQLGKREQVEPTPDEIKKARAKWRIEQIMIRAQASADAWAKDFYEKNACILTEEPSDVDTMQRCIDAFTNHYRKLQ